MTDSSQIETPTEIYIRSINDGVDAARAELIAYSCDRLRKITRTMLRRHYPGLRRWEETNDVLQLALMRMHKTLCNVHVDSRRHFYSLASMNIRQELIDLFRRHFGPEGMQANQESAAGDPPEQPAPKVGCEPETLAEWTEFHSIVQSLPKEQREAFDLLWYQQLSQNEAAAILGVSVSTLKRRWQDAKLMVYDAMQGSAPG